MARLPHVIKIPLTAAARLHAADFHWLVLHPWSWRSQLQRPIDFLEDTQQRWVDARVQGRPAVWAWLQLRQLLPRGSPHALARCDAETFSHERSRSSHARRWHHLAAGRACAAATQHIRRRQPKPCFRTSAARVQRRGRVHCVRSRRRQHRSGGFFSSGHQQLCRPLVLLPGRCSRCTTSFVTTWRHVRCVCMLVVLLTYPKVTVVVATHRIDPWWRTVL